ncbi:MAG: glycosyltransferase [Candidatus Velthaea sp.]
MSTVHAPYDTRIFQREAKGLAGRGYHVEVAMNVPQATVRQGIRVHALGDGSGPRIKRIGRNVRALRRMLEDFDIVHVHDPELLIAGSIARVFGKHVVYDIHEYYNKQLSEDGGGRYWIPSLLRPAVALGYRTTERIVLPRFAGIVVTTSEMASMYQDLVSPDRIAVVRNYPQISAEDIAAARSQAPPVEGPYIVQTGGATYMRCFHVLVEAAELMRRNGNMVPLFVLGGTNLSQYDNRRGAELLERALHANVKVIERLPYDEMLRWLAHASVGIATQPYSVNAELSFSTKVFEYFAFGIPTIVSDFGNNARIVLESGAGAVVPWEDAKSYEREITRYLEDETVRKRAVEAAHAAAKSYLFDGELANLVALYERILAQ